MWLEEICGPYFRVHETYYRRLDGFFIASTYSGILNRVAAAAIVSYVHSAEQEGY